MLNPQSILTMIDATPPIFKVEHSSLLQASKIGEACQRKLWLLFNQIGKPKELTPLQHRQRYRAKLQDGIFEMYLRENGFEFEATSFNKTTWRDGFFSGKFDGIATKDGVRYLCVYDVENSERFNQLEIGSVHGFRQMLYAQAQINAKMANCSHIIVLIANADNERVFCDVIEYDDAIANDLKIKAEYVTETDKAPDKISNKPTYHACKSCSVFGQCWGQEAPNPSCFNCTSGSKQAGTGNVKCDIGTAICDNHSFHPNVMADLYKWHPVRFLKKERAITYDTPHGTQVTNGQNFIKSKEIEI
jgi:CRISPR/Cas system-associated exonuclease Cas4 (RecB family)